MSKDTKSALVVAAVALAITIVAFVYFGVRPKSTPAEGAATAADVHSHGGGTPHSHASTPPPTTKPAKTHDHGDGKPHSH